MHGSVQLRLVKCFNAVFPNLTDEEAMRASITSVSEWDSIAAISLIVVLEEEFGTEISPDEIENMISFDLVRNYLESKNDTA